jgi:hypothetical protein
LSDTVKEQFKQHKSRQTRDQEEFETLCVNRETTPTKPLQASETITQAPPSVAIAPNPPTTNAAPNTDSSMLPPTITGTLTQQISDSGLRLELVGGRENRTLESGSQENRTSESGSCEVDTLPFETLTPTQSAGTPPNLSRSHISPPPPPTGDFDGTIYDPNLNRVCYLNRMLEHIGFDKLGKNGLDQFDNFKVNLNRAFFECCKNKIKTTVNEEIARKISEELIHRLAFAFTMNIPEFQSYHDSQIFIAECREEASERVKIWTPLLQKLRILYHKYNWGWASRLYTTAEIWSLEQTRTNTRPELFVVQQRITKKITEKVQVENQQWQQKIASDKANDEAHQRKRIECHYERIESERQKKLNGIGLSTTKAAEFTALFKDIPTKQLAEAYESEIKKRSNIGNF